MNNLTIIHKVFSWIITQLDEAASAVEYVSWITAGIFAVLAVFTIFLAHQFQTNTSESVKIAWKIRQSIKEKQPDGLKELFQDFRYFSNIPKVITSSLDISKFIIYFLAYVWGFSSLAKIVEEIKDKENSTFPYFAILLIGGSTILFVIFAKKLVQTIMQITTKDNEELVFKNIEEIKSLSKLDESGFLINNAISLDDLSWNFKVLDDDPYLEITVKRKFGLLDFAVMLNVTHPNFNIFLGTKITTTDEILELSFSEQTSSALNRIFTEENITICTYQLCLFINNKTYSFLLNPLIDTSAPKIIRLKLGTQTNWDPPIIQKNQLLRGEKVEVIDKRDI